MNPLVKIVSQIVIKSNKIIDGMNKKTIEKIKQIFYFVVFLFIILGIIIGYNSGKDAAKIQSDPIAKSTNDIFRIDVKRERDDGEFRSMLETEILGRKKKSKLNKIRFPSNEKLEINLKDRIAEPGALPEKISPPLAIDTREKIAGVSRTDERKPELDVKELKKKLHPIKDIREGEIVDEVKEKISIKRDTLEDKQKNKNKMKSIIKNTPSEERILRSIKRETGIIEK